MFFSRTQNDPGLQEGQGGLGPIGSLTTPAAPLRPHVSTFHQWETHQLLEEVAHGDLAVPLLHLGAEVVIELLVDLINVLDLVEDGLDLLDGEYGLGGGGSGLQRFHGLGERREKEQR